MSAVPQGAVIWQAPFGALDLYTWRGRQRRGPVNIVWHMPLAEVVWSLRQDGWRRFRGRPRDIELDGLRRRHDADLVRGSFFGRRMHIRLWQVGAWTVGQAHDERRRGWGHRVVGQDSARDLAARGFRGTYETVGSAGHDGRMFVAAAPRTTQHGKPRR